MLICSAIHISTRKKKGRRNGNKYTHKHTRIGNVSTVSFHQDFPSKAHNSISVACNANTVRNPKIRQDWVRNNPSGQKLTKLVRNPKTPHIRKKNIAKLIKKKRREKASG